MQRLNFNLDLLEKDNISPYYSELVNIETSEKIHSSLPIQDSLLEKKLIYIKDVPNYLKTKISSVSNKIKIKKINTYHGSLINLSEYSTINDYLLSEISTKERSEIRRRQKRLDHCIQPTYKMFYGNISKAEYEIIFNDYKQMLIRRLEQKQTYWEELDYWEERYESTYQLINEKKACVFVIYHKEKPIAIYINLIFGTTIYNEVVAYDIDFSRFNIGILIFIKIVEWSINNDFDLVDMSKGDFSYKERFRNREYKFQNHLIYNKNNIYTLLKANLLMLRLRLIYKLLPWLKKLKINELYTAYKRIKKRHFFKQYASEAKYQIETEKIETPYSLEKLKLINQELIDYAFLKKPIIDFAFLNVEFIDDILIYKEEINMNTFFFKGKRTTQKTVINNRLK